MVPSEPIATAILLTVVGILLGVSALLSRATRLGIPIVLVFLILGMLAGSEGIGRIDFEDYHLSFRVGTAALVLILFDGGLNTPWRLLREVGGPSVTLATLGVLGTAGLVGVGARFLGFSWGEAFLLGAIVSSTDAAAVFSVIRGSGLTLRRRVGATLEAESGLNDPMAVVLTLTLTESVISGRPPGFAALGYAALQLLIGAVLGYGIGRAGRWVLGRLRPPAGGLFPVLTLGIALFAFGLPTLLQGSGFLAVYVAGMVLGNGPLPYRNGVLRVHDALSWLGQVVMFLALGLLVFPSRLLAVAGPGILLALFLTIAVRPVVTMLCLAPFRFPVREQLFIGAMGLRGAVPIILGTFPILAGVSAGHRLFDLVFFVVVASVLLQGGAARGLTRLLGQGAPVPPPPAALVELSSARALNGEMRSFFLVPEAAVADVPLAEIPFPQGAGAVLVIRGEELLTPQSDLVLRPGDHVYVLGRTQDWPLLNLLFGLPEAN